VDLLVLRTPNLLAAFINNCIQIRVSVSGLGTRGVSEEVGEKVNIDGVVFVGGRRLYGGGGNRGRVAKRWGRAPNDVFGQRGSCG